MLRRFAARALGVLALLVLGSCRRDGTGPPQQLQGTLALVLRFDDGVQLVDPGQAYISISRHNGAQVADTTVAIPPGTDSLMRGFLLELDAASEQFDVFIELMHRTSGGVVFRIPQTTVTVTTAGASPHLVTTFPYVGLGFTAESIRFVTTATGVLGGDSVLFTAEALALGGQVLAGTPILWTSSDTNSARIANRSIGRVVAANVRDTVQVRASLLATAQHPAPPSQVGTLVIQPQPTAIQIQGGNNQTGTVGAALPAQIRARVVAGDNLGVQGIVVAFAVTGGGGSVSALLDTTDASGDVSVTWTLGGPAAAQSASATVTGLAGATVNFAATGTAGPAAKLAFVQEPSPALEGVVITPAVTVRAADQFGNNTALTGDVTVSLLTPAGATLSGTLTRTAAANLATFNDLSINVAGSYQLRATSGTLSSDTSAAFTIFANVPAAVTFEVQPGNVRAGASLSPSVVVAVRNGVGQIITTSNGLPVTLALDINPGPGVLAGTKTVNTISGLATFPGLSITTAASGYALVATSGALTPDTSAAFAVAPDSARSLAFATQPSSVRFEAPFSVVVEARDQYGNVSPEIAAATINVAVGTNPSGGTLSGTLSALVVQGVATFNGLSLDNIGNGYTLTASALGVTDGASNAINVVPPANGSVWINPAGGLWSVGANWSGGVVPGAADTVFIRRSGTFTVTADVNATHPRVDVGGPSGVQTLVVSGVTLNAGAGGLAINQRGRLTLDGAVLSGSSTVIHSQATLTKSGANLAAIQSAYDIDGQVLLQAGSLSLAQGSLPGTASSAAFAISGGATLDFAGGVHTLAAAGSVSGAGNAQVNAGSQVDAAGPWTLTGALTIGGGSLNYAAASGSAGTLTLNSGSLAIASAGLLTVNGPLAWSGGDLNGSGTLRVAASGSLSVNSAIARSMNGITLDILGPSDVPSTATITMGNGAVMRVGALGSMTIPGTPVLAQGMGAALFQNLGTVTRNTSAGVVTISVPYDNDGQTAINTGTLRLNGGSGSGASTGNYTVAATATLELGLAHNLSGAVSGAGTVLVNAGAVSTTGSWALTGTTNVSTGSLNYSGAAAGSTTNLILAGGSVGGTGVLNVSNAMTWSGGDLLDAGTTRVMAGATLAVTGAAARSHSARLLEVLGATTWSGSFTLSSGNGATIRNGAGVTFTISGDPLVQHTLGGAVPVFDNLGTLVRGTSAGTATLDMRIDHSGAGLTVNTGTLVLGEGGTHTGPVTLAAGTFLDYAGGTFNLGNTVGGTGTARLQSGTVGNTASADTVRFQNLVLNSGSLAPVGGVVVNASMTWTGDAALTGTGTVRVPAAVTLNITGAGTKLLTNGLLRNDGTIVYSGAGAINTGLGAQITNNGLFHWTGDGSVLSNQGGTAPRFVNAVGGTLRRSTSANAAVLGMAMNKLGAFDIQTGALELREGSLTNFAGSVTGSGLLKLAGAGRTYTLSGNMTLAGAVEVSDADLTLGGRIAAVAGNFSTSNAGSLTMNSAADSLSIAGSATFGGGSTAGKLTNGIIAVSGNFSQSGNAASFAASAAHKVRFNGAGVNQMITFANPTTSFFDSVIVDKGAGARSAVRLASDVRVNRGFVVRGSSEVNSTGSGRLKVVGKLRLVLGGTNPLVRPFVVELSNAPEIDSLPLATDGLEPDTLVYVDNVTAWHFGTPIRHKSVRVSVSGIIKPVQAFGAVQSLNGDVIVTSGTLEWDSEFDELRVKKLRVAGGTLTHTIGLIDASDSTVVTGGDAVLNGGTLKLGGHVRQSAGRITGTGNHTTVVGNATAMQRITMFNPGHGAGQSFFGKFALDNETTGGIDMASSIAARTLATTGNTNPRLFGNGNRVLTKGLLVGNGSFGRFDNVAIESDTGETDDQFDGVQFLNPSQSLVFLTVRRLGGTTSNYNGLNFPGTATMKSLNARYVRPERVGLTGIFQMRISGTPGVIDNDTCFEGLGGDVVWNGTNMTCDP